MFYCDIVKLRNRDGNRAMDDKTNDELELRNQNYKQQLYAKREYYQEIWNTQYNRSQCLKLLELTGHQFDYAIKQFDIKPTKIGHSAIFTASQLFDIKLALYLKESKYPVEVIKQFFFIKNLKKDSEILDYTFPIGGMKEFERFNVFSFSDESGTNGKLFREISRKAGTEIYNYFYQDDKEKTWYLFLDEDKLKSIGTELASEIEKTNNLSLKPVISKICVELQTSSKKHNIPVSNVA